MALSARLCSRTLLQPRAFNPLQLSRAVAIIPHPVKPPLAETHDQRNERLKRPQSPHLLIYKLQLTSVLSISHRFAGIALTGYLAGAGLLSVVSSHPLGELIQSLHGTSPALILSAKLLLAFPFAYHFCNGIRHMIWDSGKSLTIKGVYSSGFTMLAAATILTIALALL